MLWPPAGLMNVVITLDGLGELSPAEREAVAAGSHSAGTTGNNQHSPCTTINHKCQAFKQSQSFGGVPQK